MLFNRVSSVVIGVEGGEGKELANLRHAFSIQKGSVRTPNKCTLKVWNTNDNTHQLLSTTGGILILKAGYLEDIGAMTLFTGTVSRGLKRREGPDWVSDVELRDGFLEFRDIKVSVSFSPGASALAVIQNLAQQFQLPVRTLPDGIVDKQFAQGFYHVGKLREAMTKACRYLNLDWSIQNQQLQIARKGQPYSKKAYLLSPQTGMIESPQLEKKTMTEKAAAKDGIYLGQPGVVATYRRNKKGVYERRLEVQGIRVRSLLQPLMEPGGYVQIKSKEFDGKFFRIEKLTHTGDTHQAEWFTNLVLRYAE